MSIVNLLRLFMIIFLIFVVRAIYKPAGINIIEHQAILINKIHMDIEFHLYSYEFHITFSYS